MIYFSCWSPLGRISKRARRSCCVMAWQGKRIPAAEKAVISEEREKKVDQYSIMRHDLDTLLREKQDMEYSLRRREDTIARLVQKEKELRRWRSELTAREEDDRRRIDWERERSRERDLDREVRSIPRDYDDRDRDITPEKRLERGHREYERDHSRERSLSPDREHLQERDHSREHERDHLRDHSRDHSRDRDRGRARDSLHRQEQLRLDQLRQDQRALPHIPQVTVTVRTMLMAADRKEASFTLDIIDWESSLRQVRDFVEHTYGTPAALDRVDLLMHFQRNDDLVPLLSIPDMKEAATLAVEKQGVMKVYVTATPRILSAPVAKLEALGVPRPPSRPIDLKLKVDWDRGSGSKVLVTDDMSINSLAHRLHITPTDRLFAVLNGGEALDVSRSIGAQGVKEGDTISLWTHVVSIYAIQSNLCYWLLDPPSMIVSGSQSGSGPCPIVTSRRFGRNLYLSYYFPLVPRLNNPQYRHTRLAATLTPNDSLIHNASLILKCDVVVLNSQGPDSVPAVVLAHINFQLLPLACLREIISGRLAQWDPSWWMRQADDRGEDGRDRERSASQRGSRAGGLPLPHISSKVDGFEKRVVDYYDMTVRDEETMCYMKHAFCDNLRDMESSGRDHHPFFHEPKATPALLRAWFRLMEQNASWPWQHSDPSPEPIHHVPHSGPYGSGRGHDQRDRSRYDKR